MKIETETVVRKKFREYTEEEILTYYITEDGQKFTDKNRADSHEKYLNELKDLKRIINYKETNLWLCNQTDDSECLSFVFDWGPSSMSKFSKDINSLIKLNNSHIETYPKGRYICISYSTYHSENDAKDWTSYSGYFGTLESYVKFLQDEIDVAKGFLG